MQASARSVWMGDGCRDYVLADGVRRAILGNPYRISLRRQVCGVPRAVSKCPQVSLCPKVAMHAGEPDPARGTLGHLTPRRLALSGVNEDTRSVLPVKIPHFRAVDSLHLLCILNP
jgi:hypothetical protein